MNVHYHLVVPDGVFVAGDAGELSLQELRGPTDDDLLAILDRVADWRDCVATERVPRSPKIASRGPTMNESPIGSSDRGMTVGRRGSSSPKRCCEGYAGSFPHLGGIWFGTTGYLRRPRLTASSSVAVVTDAGTARSLLDGLGISHRPSVFTPRGPPELFDDPSPAFEADPPAPDE